MPRNYANKRLKGKGRNQRTKKYFKKKTTNSLYRNSIPRTLQVATRRNTKQMLRFVSNQVYKVVAGGDVGGTENTFLKFRANSIYDINIGNSGNGSLNPANTWLPQDPSKYGPSQATVNAEGFSDWQARYSHFTVVGSRIQATFEPFGIPSGAGLKQVPTTVYINLAGNTSQISTGTEMSTISELPYTKRAGIIPSQTNSIQTGALSTSNFGNGGVRLFSHYSAKKFEGVHDVADNDQLRGNMLTDPAVPQEGSFFTVGLRNTIPTTSADDRMPQGIMRVKIEYITLLTEPTSTNQVQEPASIFSAQMSGY